MGTAPPAIKDRTAVAAVASEFALFNGGAPH